MNKLFTKVAALSVGLALAIGVGVAVGGQKAVRVKGVDTDTYDVSDTALSTLTSGTKVVWGLEDKSLAANSTVESNWLRMSSNESDWAVYEIEEVSGSFYLKYSSTYIYSSAVKKMAFDSTNKTAITLGDGGLVQATTLGVYVYNANNGNGGIRPYATVGSLVNTYLFEVTEKEEPDVLESISVSGSMTKKNYYVGESWSANGLVATGSFESGETKDITSKVTWSFSPSAPALNVSSVVATATYGGKSASSSAQAVTVARTNPIKVLYTQSSGASVDVYGYYVGFLDGTGPVIMDGEYGIVVFNKSADVSKYTVNETILHVTGSITIYNGLYEIGSSAIAVATSVPEDKVPSTPVVYATKGGETADYASRLTTVTGTATVTSGSFDSAAGTADIKMNFTDGTKTIQVFYKKAAQTADADCFAAMKAAVTNSTEITIKGFTSWFNGFQVQMNGYIPPAEDYTAEDFAQDLLDQTDAVCTGWKEGDNNHDALEAIWSDLASNDKYPSLPAAEKTILAEAERDESGTVVEQAMARYDFLTGKYNLSNFINGRTPIVSQRGYLELNAESNNNTMIIIVVIASVSAIALATLLILKKKKHN